MLPCALAGKVFTRIGYVSEYQQLPGWMAAGEMLASYRNFCPAWDRSLETQLARQFDLRLNTSSSTSVRRG